MVPQALAMFVRSETLRLTQYLTTLRALPREGAAVQVLVVAPPGQRAAFEQALVSDARLAFHTFDAAAAAQACGLKRVPEGTLAEALYLQLLAKKPPKEQFARGEDRRRYFIWRLQRGIVAAGALGFAGCALFAGSKWFDGMQLRGQAEAQQQQARQAAEQYQRITAGFPVTQTTTDNLKATVLEFQRIASQSSSPERSFLHLSRVLEQFPQIEIDELDWSVGRAGAGEAAPAKPPAEAAGAAKPPAGAEVAEFLEVAGRVNATQRSDYRGITAQVQRFAAALSEGSPYQLVRTRLPFDITSEGTLTGDIGGADTGQAPRFAVTISRKLP
jgi:hypothetical protein